MSHVSAADACQPSCTVIAAPGSEANDEELLPSLVLNVLYVVGLIVFAVLIGMVSCSKVFTMLPIDVNYLICIHRLARRLRFRCSNSDTVARSSTSRTTF